MLLEELQKPYGALLMEVEQRIRTVLLAGAHAELSALIQAAPIHGGKKIRSSFLFMLLSREKEAALAAVELAAAVEMLHQASLIHDDVLDHALVRRHQPTLHRQVDNTRAVLVGDYMFMKAFELALSYRRFDLMRSLQEASCRLVTGQIVDMKPALTRLGSFDDYIGVLEAKTGALFAAAAESAALLKHGKKENVLAHKRFGALFGVLFQLQDDVLDLFSMKTGKDRWSDIREGKWTLPTLLLEESDSELEVFPFREDKTARIEEALKKHEILERCREIIDRYRRRTLDCLEPLMRQGADENMKGLIDYVCRRER